MIARIALMTLVLSSTVQAHDISPPPGDVEVRLVCASGCD